MKGEIMSTLYNRKIQAIVLHHMGDGQSPSVSILKRWNPHAYQFPEYDFGVEADGTIRQGRPLNYQGSHCLSDKPPYSQKGDQWWNQNSIGIGIAGDFTKFPMPIAQFNGLVELVKKLMSQYNLTLDNCYPHGQVTLTQCPGCTYSKVPALKGGWNYDAFETAVKSSPVVPKPTPVPTPVKPIIKPIINNNKGVDFKMDVCIVYFSPSDFSSALILSRLNGNCAMFCRNSLPAVHADAMKSLKIITVGGPKLGVAGEVYLSGADSAKTLIAVSNYLQGK